ncbi:MAG TPA: zinc-binding alcohol dehydrogenase [Anaerolineales bacterium]|nr:zinc-binding alcohol dehydrogenase [Anaerolineales bacterium]
MGNVVVFTEPRKVGFESYEDRPLKSHEVRLRTSYSGISAGTELTAYRGSNPYLHKQWDPSRKLFVPSEEPSLQYPVSGWGYEEVGEVVEVGSEVQDVSIGDVIFGTWGHRTHHIVPEEYARDRVQAKSLEAMFGLFSQIGAIALNGVHDARIRIGETVVVFGMGTLGQIVGRLAKKSGAQVIGVDRFEKRLEIARQSHAADIVLNAEDGEVAERIRAITDNRGADVAIEATGSSRALNEAVRSVAYSAKVVALGFFQGEAAGLFLGEEFHHNRVNIVGSQIFGTDPELTYRWNQLRLVQTFMRLQTEGVIDLKSIVTHIIPAKEAEEAFRILDQEPENALQIVLDFTHV